MWRLLCLYSSDRVAHDQRPGGRLEQQLFITHLLCLLWYMKKVGRRKVFLLSAEEPPAMVMNYCVNVIWQSPFECFSRLGAPCWFIVYRIFFLATKQIQNGSVVCSVESHPIIPHNVSSHPNEPVSKRSSPECITPERRRWAGGEARFHRGGKWFCLICNEGDDVSVWGL